MKNVEKKLFAGSKKTIKIACKDHVLKKIVCIEVRETCNLLKKKKKKNFQLKVKFPLKVCNYF